jgi:hypothetical protein
MDGIGREYGIDNLSPRCSARNRKPASNLAARENGGVRISPCNHASGLSFGLMRKYDMSNLT